MNASKINVLIADDDTEDVQVLTEVLSEIISFEWLRVKDGIECLRTLKTGNKPDLVFLDINMPLKNGLECLRDISNHALLPDTPVIIYSTSHNMKDIDTAYKYGARAYLVKPSSFTVLKQLLKMVFKKLGEPLKQQLEKGSFVVWEKQLNRT